MATPINPIFGADQLLASQDCQMCGVHKPVADFTRQGPTGYVTTCRDCAREYRLAKKGGQVNGLVKAPVAKPVLGANDYIASRELLNTWAAAQLLAARGDLPSNMLFIGPSGSGKSAAAEYLAKLSGLEFTKVDAPSITDPDAWFGTREVVVEDGASKTIYHPSVFVESIQRPGVTLVDELNRVPDSIRNGLLGLADASRQVTNPITGEPVVRHPGNFLIFTGNVGVQFSGTYAVDPAFLTRSLVTRFTYLDVASETALLVARTGCSPEQAAILVRLASDTRALAQSDEDFPPISTREILEAAKLIAVGLDENTAVHQAIINAADTSGGAESIAAKLEMTWTGIRPRSSGPAF